MNPQIVVRLDDGSSVQLSIEEGESVVGRDAQSSLIVPSPLVSGSHALVAWDGRSLRLKDLESTNGTYVNGTRVTTGWRDLSEGDTLRFGGVDAMVVLDSTGAEEIRMPAPPQSMRPRAVFVSHSSYDRQFAYAMVDQLEALGVTCWIAPRDVAPGDDFASQVTRAIQTCGSLLVIVSDAASASPHVRRELEAASRVHRRIVPLRVAGAIVGDDLAFFFAGTQWIDCSGSLDSQTVDLVAGALTRRPLGFDERPAPPLESVLGSAVVDLNIRIRHPTATLALIMSSSVVFAPVGLITSLFYLMAPRRPEPGQFVAWWAFWVGGIVTMFASVAIATCYSQGLCAASTQDIWTVLRQISIVRLVAG